jgi:molecular chaperone GrpE
MKQPKPQPNPKQEQPEAQAPEQVSEPAKEHLAQTDRQPQAPGDEVAQLRQALDAAAQQVDSMRDQLLRAMADVDNTKKRLEREREAFRRFAAETTVRRLLPIMDSLEQALRSSPVSAECAHLIEGMRLMHKQILDVLKQECVEPIAAAGKPFDPHLHEAVLVEEVDDAAKDNCVLEELQVGYTMHGKLVRSAMVKIARHKNT